MKAVPRPSETVRRRPDTVSRSTFALTVATAGLAPRTSGAKELALPSALTSAGERAAGGAEAEAADSLAAGSAPGGRFAEAAPDDGEPLRPLPQAAIANMSQATKTSAARRTM